LFPTSQALEAALNWLDIWGHPHTPALLSGQLPTCESDIGNCNYWGSPQLYGLTAKTGNKPPGSTDPHWSLDSGLDWEGVMQEIVAGRPIVFVWDYASNGSTKHRPVGRHQLVATGYSDELDGTGTRYLQIWDPWPVPNPLPSEVPACGPAPGVQVVTDDHS